MGQRIRTAVLSTLVAAFSLGGALAQPAVEDRAVAGLQGPAEIRIDRWGVSHIYADSVRDAFFLQGYNVARDRLWQVDLWRKRGLGLLARDFGPSFVDQDRAARLFLYRGDMEAEWRAYGPSAKGYAEAFVAGLNAYVAEIDSGARPLPREFEITNTRPDRWQAQDVVRIRSHGLTRNAAAEVERAQITCAAGLQANALNRKLEPAHALSLPAGLDPCAVPADVLADYKLGTDAVSFEAGQIVTAAVDVPADAIGSNNWTVSPPRTSTGRPILANDPHRAHGAPSLRYIVHLEAPGFSVIGAGEPALPGISIGHNGQIAFGLTIFPADQEDLYVYELHPQGPGLYRYGQGWEPIRTLIETIPVRGGEAQSVTLQFTRHGPVLKVDADNRRAFALRSVWAAPGSSAYFGSADYMTARSWPEFQTALARFGAPSENQVYADVEGHIGWQAAGFVPKRDNWDGLTPVPGDGRYEWDGFIPADQLPSAFDPAQGWLATANQFNLPEGYPAERQVGYEWSNSARMDRIAQVLSADAEHSLADSMALQTDPTNITAMRLVPYVEAMRTNDPTARAAQALLRGYDGRATVQSGPAALYEVWLIKHLGRATVAAQAPEAARVLIGAGDLPAVMDRLDALPATERDPILARSLKAAFEEVRTRLGADTRRWAWGDLHQARFEHPLTALAPASEAEAMGVGPAPVAGTMLSPLAASWRTSDYRIVAGASFRMVLDVGQWDNSVVINTPGQSGDPASPHFGDLFPRWAKGEYVPLVYSRAAVEAATETVMRLTPAGGR